MQGPMRTVLCLQVCCQQPLWRIGSSTAGSGSRKTSDPTCWRAAEGVSYKALLEWLRGCIDSCPGADTLRFGIQKLAGDHLAALTP